MGYCVLLVNLQYQVKVIAVLLRNILLFGIATTQHVVLQTLVANKYSMCAKKKVVPELNSKSVPSACETGALPSELQGSVLAEFWGTLHSIVCM